jgi:DNA replication and repair protein RecF
MLDVFNQQLAVECANIVFLRKKYLSELEKIAQIKHSKMAQNENLIIKYNTISDEDLSVVDLNRLIYDKLNEVKDDEIRRAQCLIGAHRDDVDFYINNIDSKKYASQGQQRTIVLSLKLAELAFIKEKINVDAILLLDDVLAELDDIRQNYLLNAIDKGTQTIITSVDTLNFKEEYLKDVEIFEIKDNNILLLQNKV